MQRLTPSTIRRLLWLAAVVLLVASIARGSLHWILRDDVRRVVMDSALIADQNRAFVVDSQDWLAIVWLMLPVIVGLLAIVTLLLGIGHLLLIGTSCVIGSTLLVTGLLFPTLPVLHVLTVPAIAALLALVALIVSHPRALLSRDTGAVPR